MDALSTVIILFSVAVGNVPNCFPNNNDTIKCFDLILPKTSRTNFVGNIKTKRNRFSIYIYKNVFGESRRMNRRLILFKNRKFYGSVDLGENDNCVTRKMIVKCDGNWDSGNIIRFQENGPPSNFLFGGEVVNFESERPS